MMEKSQSDVPKKVVRLMEPSVELKTEEIKTK